MIPDEPTADQAKAAVAALAQPLYGERYVRHCPCCAVFEPVRIYSTKDNFVSYEATAYRYSVTLAFWEQALADGLYVFQP